MVFGATLIGLLLVEYIIIGLYFRKHFYVNTYISGVDCSNLTAEAANAAIQQEVKDYKLIVKSKNNSIQQITGDSIEIAYQYQQKAEELIKKQKPYLWIGKIFQNHALDNPSEIVYNKEKLNQYLDKICNSQKVKKISSKNARISSYDEKTGFSIIKEVVGNELDRNLVDKAVERSIHSLSPSLSLDKEGCYILPTVTSSSPVIKKALETINCFMKTKLTYQFGTKTEVLDKKLIGPAIIVDANNHVSLDEKKLENYVAYLAKTYNNPKGSWKFQSSYKRQVVMKGGDFEWILDEKQELKQIIECIQKGQEMVKKPTASMDSLNKEYRTFGDTYVEINKKKQHLFFYKKGVLVLESDVVTGILRGGHDTPVGLYYISQMQRNRVLRGFNDDGSKYAAFVQYWMRFNGGIGLHDAPWQPYFGGNRYLYAGSHGCVNLPPQVARKLYGMVELYTPVVVYW